MLEPGVKVILASLAGRLRTKHPARAWSTRTARICCAWASLTKPALDVSRGCLKREAAKLIKSGYRDGGRKFGAAKGGSVQPFVAQDPVPRI